MYAIRSIAILFFLTVLLTACRVSPSDKNMGASVQPNILFIMSDDHAYQAISAYDSSLTSTPNIDRIAAEGMLFNEAGVTNSICAPSRAVIFTGKHCHINGKIDNRSPFDTTNITFPQIMQKQGYQTALFGKLHFGNNPRGFDQFKILPGQGAYYNPEFITKYDGNITVEGYTTDIITDMVLEWFNNEYDTSKPFLMMYLHKAPHREWLPAERHYQEFIHKTFPEPLTLFDNYKNRMAAKTAELTIRDHMNWAGDMKIYPEVMDELGIRETVGWDKDAFYREVGRLNDQQRAAWDAVYGPMNETFKEMYPKMSDNELLIWKYQRYMQDYTGTIAAIDEGVGKILDYLEENGLSENTIVVYTSDQGFFLGEHGWFDKRFIYDESFKTPLLVRWPAVISPGSVCNELVQNLDFAQTFLEAAKITPPDDMQGESLIPLFRKELKNWNRDALYYHYYEYPGITMVKRHYGIVTKEYKLVHFYYDIDEWELYDRKKDPLEINNVINDPAYTIIKKTLTTQLEEIRKKYKDSTELDQYFIEMYNKQ